MSIRRVLTGLGATALVAALAIPLLAQAQPQPPGPGGQRGPRGWQGMMANQLNLTQDQRDQIKKLHEQNRAALKDQMAKLGDLRHQLNDQLLSDTPDQAQITTLVGQIGQLQQQLFAQRIQLRQQTLAVFTPEQRQQLRQWEQNHPNFGMGPMGRGRHFRAPGGGGF